MALYSEYVTINSVVLALDGAWKLEDTTPLIGQGPSRGTDRIIPGTAGVQYRAKTLDAFRVPLVLIVFGLKDKDGSAYADERVGLRDNLEYLETNLLAANVGEVTISHTFSSGSRSGSGYVADMVVADRVTQRGTSARAVLDVVLTDGKLA